MFSWILICPVYFDVVNPLLESGNKINKKMFLHQVKLSFYQYLYIEFARNCKQLLLKVWQFFNKRFWGTKIKSNSWSFSDNLKFEF